MWANKPEMARAWTLEETNQLKSPARLLKKFKRWEKSHYQKEEQIESTTGKIDLPDNVEKLVDVYERNWWNYRRLC